MYFFFNDTAPTGIYTYGHTLSLHDALPIYRMIDKRPIAPHLGRHGKGRNLHQGILRLLRARGWTSSTACIRRGTSGSTCIRCCGRRRSEEHTSELQSLMRISYAVFCLKKKKAQMAQILRPHIEPNCN